MTFANRFEKLFKSVLPTPFTIAVLLTFLTFLLALFLTKPQQQGNHFIQLLRFWEQGLWHSPLLVFAMQMMLMLVLGHVLALSKPIDKLIAKGTQYCNNTANAAAIITFSTLLVAFLIGDWGLFLEQFSPEKWENMPLKKALI